MVTPIPAILGTEMATPQHFLSIFPDGDSPDLLLADVGGSPAEVLDNFRHLHTYNGEAGQ